MGILAGRGRTGLQRTAPWEASKVARQGHGKRHGRKRDSKESPESSYQHTVICTSDSTKSQVVRTGKELSKTSPWFKCLGQRPEHARQGREPTGQQGWPMQVQKTGPEPAPAKAGANAVWKSRRRYAQFPLEVEPSPRGDCSRPPKGLGHKCVYIHVGMLASFHTHEGTDQPVGCHSHCKQASRKQHFNHNNGITLP